MTVTNSLLGTIKLMLHAYFLLLFQLPTAMTGLVVSVTEVEDRRGTD